jgi:2-dehydro-3-deoxygluconokinase
MAIAAARLGARAGYVSRVGDDAFGRALLRLWADERVDARGVATDSGAPTGVYFVTHGPSGHEFSYLRVGSAASRMEPASLPMDVIRGARLVHVSGISQAISGSACDTVFRGHRSGDRGRSPRVVRSEPAPEAVVVAARPAR